MIKGVNEISQFEGFEIVDIWWDRQDAKVVSCTSSDGISPSIIHQLEYAMRELFLIDSLLTQDAEDMVRSGHPRVFYILGGCYLVRLSASADYLRAQVILIQKMADENLKKKNVTLSRRQKEVFDLLICGMGNREIGERLYISKNTVDVHRTNIYKKFGVNSFRELYTAYHAGLEVESVEG